MTDKRFTPPTTMPDHPGYGIIDPDYARIFTQARIIAWQHGYSCSAQGSFTRDLDLLFVPWVEPVTRDFNTVLLHFASTANLKVSDEPSLRPHGRKTWTLMLPGFGEVRWVDLSAFTVDSRDEKTA